MIQPRIFYDAYLIDYHKFKSILVKTVLENLSQYEIDLFGEELNKEDKKHLSSQFKVI